MSAGGPILHRHADAAALYAAAASALLSRAQSAIEARGHFSLALAGGNTPRPLYEALAAAPVRDALDWSRVHIWFGDERCVAPDSPRSNYRMADEALLRHVPLLPAQIHRMRGEQPPDQAAQAYERELIAHFGSGWPALDLILLGLGDDGHTASLFPGTEVLHERQHRVSAQYVAVQNEWRLTLTLPVLNAATALWVLVLGSGKAEILARVLDGARDPEQLPIQALAPQPGRLEWWLDAGAASQLSPPGTAA